MEDSELYHHGIKGMKWGVRRTREQLGYRTSPKKKKRSSNDENVFMKTAKKTGKAISTTASNASAKHKAKKEEERRTKEARARNEKLKNKPISDMTDEELRQKIQRIQLENQYKALNPKKVSAGEKFAKTVLNDVIAPAVKNAGRQYLEKSLKKSLGLDEKQIDDMAKLRKEAEEWRLKSQIATAKKVVKNGGSVKNDSSKSDNPKNESAKQEKQQNKRSDPESTYETSKAKVYDNYGSYKEVPVEIIMNDPDIKRIERQIAGLLEDRSGRRYR